MPGYTLKINSFVFAVTPEVFPQLDYNWKRDGSQISVKETWPLRCWFVRDSVADIRSDWNAFLALIETGAPQNVQFLFNGAPVDDLLTSINNNTPRFENIHVVNQGGLSWVGAYVSTAAAISLLAVWKMRETRDSRF